MSLTLAAWHNRRQARLELARLALTRSDALANVLSAWRFADRPEVLLDFQRVLPSSPTPSEAVLAWAFANPTMRRRASRPEFEWETLASRSPAPVLRASDRQAAALFALGRLGEEYAIRERDVWCQPAPADALADREAAERWKRLLVDNAVIAQEDAAWLYSKATRNALAAVGHGLRIPAAMIRFHQQRAAEVLDQLCWGAQWEIACRVLEASGEPIARLAQVAITRAEKDFEDWLGERPHWAESYATIGAGVPAAERLSLASELFIAKRILRALPTVEPNAGGVDLPGWSVVRANHHRMRGRLRAFCHDEHDIVRATLLRTPGLKARTEAAAGRWAWAWAWREARSGFTFSVENATTEAWRRRGLGSAPLPPFTVGDASAIQTWLLCVLGRGLWPELERWVSGTPGRELSGSFYRYLAAAPAQLADPHTEPARSRSYHRLRAHLGQGGLDEYVPELMQACRAAEGVSEGRELGPRLRKALGDWWDEQALPLPKHHLTPFRRNLASFPFPDPPRRDT